MFVNSGGLNNIGIDTENKSFESILEICEKKGYNSGIIVTSSIVHATPASFYAKVISRANYQEIAYQLSKSEVDFFIGGGEKHFIKRNDRKKHRKRGRKKKMQSTPHYNDQPTF